MAHCDLGNRVCERACVRACVRACIRACVRVCACGEQVSSQEAPHAQGGTSLGQQVSMVPPASVVVAVGPSLAAGVRRWAELGPSLAAGVRR